MLDDIVPVRLFPKTVNAPVQCTIMRCNEIRISVRHVKIVLTPTTKI